MERENIIPVEIIEEILFRVPVKSLLKFRCVSKSWLYLIGSDRFIRTHLQISSSCSSKSRHRIFLNHHPNSPRGAMHCSLQTLFNESVINPVDFIDLCLSDITWRPINLVGCCNGLVCILVNDVFLYMWNPSLRLLKKLPSRELCRKNLVSYGFGFDESCNDYKVFFNFCYGTSVGCSEIGSVYSLKSNSWKRLTNEWDHLPLPFEDGAGKFVSGNLHWIVTTKDSETKWYIISFDFKNEVYRFVELPRCSKGIFKKTLGVIEGGLSVVCDYPQTQIDIWVMKEYMVTESWIKVATLANIYNDPLEGRFLSPIAWGPYGEILLFYGAAVRLYNSKDEDPQRVIIESIHEVDVYVESLVPLAPDDDKFEW